MTVAAGDLCHWNRDRGPNESPCSNRIDGSPCSSSSGNICVFCPEHCHGTRPMPEPVERPPLTRAMLLAEVKRVFGDRKGADAILKALEDRLPTDGRRKMERGAYPPPGWWQSPRKEEPIHLHDIRNGHLVNTIKALRAAAHHPENEDRPVRFKYIELVKEAQWRGLNDPDVPELLSGVLPKEGKRTICASCDGLGYHNAVRIEPACSHPLTQGHRLNPNEFPPRYQCSGCDDFFFIDTDGVRIAYSPCMSTLMCTRMAGHGGDCGP